MARRGYSTIYASADDLKRLDTYQYKGVDRSILSRLVLQRYWSWLVEFLPLWMAPNMVTLLGLAAILVNLATLLFFSPDLQAPCPTWAYVSFGIGLFVYTSLDAIDGKQARRTKTSSPLGELFDHGVDALNTTLGCVLLVHTVNLNQSWALQLFLAVSLTYFFCSTWETYHTGTLYLGRVNGPVEGTLTLCLVYFFTAYIGRDSWRLTLGDLPALQSLWGFLRLDSLFHLSDLIKWAIGAPKETIPLNYLVLAGPAISLSWVVLSSLRRVRAHYLRQDPKNTGGRSPRAQWHSALLDLFPMVSLLVLSFVWLAGSPSDIVHTRGLPFAAIVGLEFAMIVGRIILAHLLHMRHPRLFPGLLFLVLLAANSFLNLYSGKGAGFLNAETEVWGLYAHLAVTVLVYSHMVVTVINQLCAYLDINCLTIKKKQH